MISFVSGKLFSKTPTTAVVETNGVGLEMLIPLSTFDALGNVNDSVQLLTHLHVREDALILFGFATAEERELFRDLLSVSGIGPKLAFVILNIYLMPYKIDDENKHQWTYHNPLRATTYWNFYLPVI